MIVFGQTFPVKSRKISKQIAVLQKNVPVLNIPNEHLCYQPQNMKKLQCCKKCFCFKHLQQISVLSGEVGDPGDGSPASAAEQRDPASLEAGQRRRRLRSTRGLNLSSPLETENFCRYLFLGSVFDFSETSTTMLPPLNKRLRNVEFIQFC